MGGVGGGGRHARIVTQDVVVVAVDVNANLHNKQGGCAVAVQACAHRVCFSTVHVCRAKCTCLGLF